MARFISQPNLPTPISFMIWMVRHGHRSCRTVLAPTSDCSGYEKAAKGPLEDNCLHPPSSYIVFQCSVSFVTSQLFRVVPTGPGSEYSSNIVHPLTFHLPAHLPEASPGGRPIVDAPSMNVERFRPEVKVKGRLLIVCNRRNPFPLIRQFMSVGNIIAERSVSYPIKTENTTDKPSNIIVSAHIK
jgi:hypothetical protein